MVNRQHWVLFWFRKLSVDLWHFQVFVFCPETTENFCRIIFQGIKTIYLIWSTFLSILCGQDLTFKVLLKVIKDNLPFKLESSFFVIKVKLYLDNKVIAF